MTRSEFLNEYALSEELKEFTASGRDEMWFYCVGDDRESFVVCHFFYDSITDNIDYEEFQIVELDTEEKWQDLIKENGYTLEKDTDVWTDGIDQFVKDMNSDFRWIEPPMYDTNWSPDSMEEIEVEEGKSR